MKCPICFKKVNYTTECNHHFCKKCLYHWKSTCPLCRKYIVLKYPSTRAMSTRQGVMDSIKILLDNIARVEESKYKIKYAEKLLQHFWDNRIVIRKYGRLCKTIHEKSAEIKKDCLSLGFPPPTILKKTLTI